MYVCCALRVHNLVIISLDMSRITNLSSIIDLIGRAIWMFCFQMINLGRVDEDAHAILYGSKTDNKMYISIETIRPPRVMGYKRRSGIKEVDIMKFRVHMVSYYTKYIK